MPHYDEARGLLGSIARQNATLVADATHAAPSKATPVDADELPLADSVSAFSLAKLTWANLKAAIKTYLSGIAFPIGATTASTGAFTGVTITTGQLDFSNLAGGAQFNNYRTGNIELVNRNGGGIDFYTGATLLNATLGATGNFTVTGTMKSIGGATFHSTSSALANGAGVAAGTLLTAPVAGNPTKWIGINDNGTIRYIPAW